VRQKLQSYNHENGFASQRNLLEYSEDKNVSDTAFEEGEKRGMKKGIEQGELTKAREIAR
jgi:hypothetical protein